MTDIVVVGGGGHAKVIISILMKPGMYNILGYTDISDRGDILGVSFIGNDRKLDDISKDRPSCSVVVGLGIAKRFDIEKRHSIFELLNLSRFEMPSIVSIDAKVNEQVRFGAGTVVMDGVVINSGTEIGDCSILNTHCSVDHDCSVGDFVHICPGVTVCGGVSIGNNVMVGAGSTICPNVSIADDSLIGAGAVVIEDCTEPGSFIGVPARKIG